jgi:hypothetical protein
MGRDGSASPITRDEDADTRDSSTGVGSVIIDTAISYNNPVTTGQGAMKYFSGENITTTDGVIKTADMIGAQGFSWSNQSNQNNTYGFKTKNLDSLSTTESDEMEVKFNGAAAVIQIKGINFIPSGGSSTTEQPIKIFAIGTSGDPPLFHGYGYSMTTLGKSNVPYSYEGLQEGLNLQKKFGFDSATYDDITPSIFVQDKIKEFANTIVNDLQTGVLSRIDVVKTTAPLEMDKATFELITEDEAAETDFFTSVPGTARPTTTIIATPDATPVDSTGRRVATTFSSDSISGGGGSY